MRTIISVLLCSAVALGAEPADAPLAEGRSMLVEAGTIVPFRGVCLDEPEHVRREKINERNVGELADAKSNVWASKATLVVVIVGAFVVGAAAGAGVVAWAMKR